MANSAPPAPPPKQTPLTHTTRRGIATASFCLGFWGTLTFWWYPFGMAIASVGLALAILSIMMGWRASREGGHLAWLGAFFGATGIGLAMTAYRFVQLAFEGTPPPAIQEVFPFSIY